MVRAPKGKRRQVAALQRADPSACQRNATSGDSHFQLHPLHPILLTTARDVMHMEPRKNGTRRKLPIFLGANRQVVAGGRKLGSQIARNETAKPDPVSGMVVV